MRPDRPPAEPWRPTGAGVALSVALLVLAWGAAPYLPGQIDDAYIVFSYAHRVVERGEIAWNTGERVEGYSSPLHLMLMVLGALAGLDLSVFARVLSFAAVVALLGALSRPGFGPGRSWLLLFLAAWQPLQLWSVGALETALGTLIGCLGWTLALGSGATWSAGCLALTVFSLTRPEGAAWLVLGLLLRVRAPWGWGPPERRVLAALIALAAYHAGRVAYFGALLPTPWLVKIVAVDRFAAGARELGPELLSAAPMVALALLLRRGAPLIAWLPLVVQAALLVRAGGDWMGNARFLLPGVVASVAAVFARGAPRPMARWVPAALLPLVALGFHWEPWQMQAAGPRWRDRWSLAHPLATARTPWEVPLLDEVAFLVGRIPAGAGAMMSDVGLPGNLSDVRIWDGAGLTDRVVAEIIAGESDGISATLAARFEDPLAIWCQRYGLDEQGRDPADPWMVALLPVVATKPDARGQIWRCREGEGPSPELVLTRWRGLLERFPRQDLIRWQLARALIQQDRADEALELARGATWIGADAHGWVVFRPEAGEAYVPGRGWPLYRDGALLSAVLPDAFWRGHELWLDADDPGEEGALARLGWEPACGDPRTVEVRARQVAAPPPCEGATRALKVELLNDRWSPDADRNLYVTLRPRGAPHAD